jgi:hypothetical protein
MDRFINRLGEMAEKIVDRKLSAPSDFTSATTRFGTVTDAIGRPQVLLDGDDVPSGKRYPHLTSYIPTIGDRVLLSRDSGGTWIVIGKLAESSTPAVWVAPTLENGWSNFGGAWVPAGYMKDSNGIVHLRGLLRPGTMVAGTPIFTLPTGFRPVSNEMFPVASYLGGTGYVGGTTEVYPNGQVRVLTGGTDHFSISGISFSII